MSQARETSNQFRHRGRIAAEAINRGDTGQLGEAMLHRRSEGSRCTQIHEDGLVGSQIMLDKESRRSVLAVAGRPIGRLPLQIAPLTLSDVEGGTTS